MNLTDRGSLSVYHCHVWTTDNIYMAMHY